MNINFYNTNSQFEFFPKTAAVLQDQIRPRFLLKDLSLSLENTIVFCIMLVMVIVLFFSFGVEHGKRLAMARSHQEINLVTPEKNDILRPSIGPKNSVSATPAKRTPAVKNIAIEEKPVVGEHKSLDTSPSPIASQAYTIQVASFKQEKYAQQEATLLQKIGYETYVLLKGSHSIVCVGKFLQKSEAESFSKRLKRKYSDCLVRRF